MPENSLLVQRLHAEGRPFRCAPDAHDRTLKDSAVVVAIAATITAEDGPSQPGVALFAGRRYPALVVTREAAERLADQLDHLLAADLMDDRPSVDPTPKETHQ